MSNTSTLHRELTFLVSYSVDPGSAGDRENPPYDPSVWDIDAVVVTNDGRELKLPVELVAYLFDNDEAHEEFLADAREAAIADAEAHAEYLADQREEQQFSRREPEQDWLE